MAGKALRAVRRQLTPRDAATEPGVMAGKALRWMLSRVRPKIPLRNPAETARKAGQDREQDSQRLHAATEPGRDGREGSSPES